MFQAHTHTVGGNGTSHQVSNLWIKEQAQATTQRRDQPTQPRFVIVGLGDLVDLLTTCLGIKYLFKLLVKECGCERRRVLLNRFLTVRFLRPGFLARKKRAVDKPQQRSSCGGCGGCGGGLVLDEVRSPGASSPPPSPS